VLEGVWRTQGRDGTRSAKRDAQDLRRLSRQPWLIGLACVCIAALTIEVLHPPAASVPELRSMFAAWTAVAAFIAAYALISEFRQTWRLRTLLLFIGATVLGTLIAVASVLLAFVHVHAGQSVTAGPAFGAVLAAGCLASAAATPADRVLPVHWPWERLALFAVMICVCAAEGLGVWLVTALNPTSNVLRGMSAEGRPWAIAIFVVTIMLFGLSAARFAAESDEDGSNLSTMLAAGCLLLAFGPAERIITPAPSPDVISVAVITELAAFSLIAIYARRRLHVHHLRTREAAAAREARSRLARDLHDGLCQDLAFIVSSVLALTGDAGEQHPLAIASQRAMATARGVLEQFAVTDAGVDVATALKAVAAELSLRFSITVDVRAHMLDLTPADTDDLVRIAREAIVNAARHSGASKVQVELSGQPGSLLLTVSDDGRGIKSAAALQEGFGMTAMRERAARLGGSLTTAAGRNGGTDLRVVVSR
jgi:signal transduction histidine kinase